MPLETGTYISDLNASNPVGATDPKSQGDDHIRLIKSTLLATFPNIDGEVTATDTDLNNLILKNKTGNVISYSPTLPSDPGLELSSTRPILVLNETDAAADEGRWYLHASGGELQCVAINDANNSSETIYRVTRTGIALGYWVYGNGMFVRFPDAAGTDYMDVNHNGTDLVADYTNTNYHRFRDLTVGVIFEDGAVTRHYDAANEDYLSINHTGSNASILTTGTGVPGNIQMTANGGAASVQMISGTGLQWFDSGNLHNVKISHDGTDLNVVASASTVGLDFQDFDNVRFLDGVEFRIQGGGSWRLHDSTDADYVDFVHNGTNLVTTFAGTTAWNIDGVPVYFRGGTQIRVYDLSNVDYVGFSHDGTDGKVNLVGGELDFQSVTIKSDNDTADEPGWKGTPVETQNGDYTLTLDDAGTTKRKSGGGAGETYTIPANASVAFPVGTIIQFINQGGDDLTIAITTDTLVELGSGSTGSRTLANNGKAVIEKVDTTQWIIGGVGVS